MREPSEFTKDAVRDIGRLANSFSFNAKDIAEYFAQVEHRTIQQNLTRFCIEWLKVCASEDYGYDGRNEASHEVAKELLDGHDVRGLPFI